jgi:hypothetical protein
LIESFAKVLKTSKKVQINILTENYDDQELPEINGVATSVAQAYPEAREEEEEFASDEEQPVEEKPIAAPVAPESADLPEEEPTSLVPSKKKSPPKALSEEEDDEEEDEPVYKRNRAQQGGSPIYFPVSFGKTNGGAIGRRQKFMNLIDPNLADVFIKFLSRR